jgi:hypothetical protein
MTITESAIARRRFLLSSDFIDPVPSVPHAASQAALRPKPGHSTTVMAEIRRDFYAGSPAFAKRGAHLL